MPSAFSTKLVRNLVLQEWISSYIWSHGWNYILRSDSSSAGIGQSGRIPSVKKGEKKGGGKENNGGFYLRIREDTFLPGHVSRHLARRRANRSRLRRLRRVLGQVLTGEGKNPIRSRETRNLNFERWREGWREGWRRQGKERWGVAPRGFPPTKSTRDITSAAVEVDVVVVVVVRERDAL